MKTIEVEITGVSPLLMRRFDEQAQEQVQSGTSGGKALGTATEQAERAAYRLPSNGVIGNLYIPSSNILASIRKAAKFRKIGKRSAITAICAGVSIRPDVLDLGTHTYEIDSRRVVNPATKGACMRHRPKLNTWKLRFFLEYDDRHIPSPEVLRGVVDDSGAIVGICDFRPEKKGSFGRFVVTAWKGI